MLENLEIIIESIPLILSFGFALYFYFNKSFRKHSNRYLSLFFFSFVTIQLFLVFSDLTDDNYGKLLLPLIVGGSLIIPPSMYTYVNSLTLNVRSISWKKLFLPGIVFFVLNLVVFSIIIFFKSNTSVIVIIEPLLNYTTLLPIVVIFPLMAIYFIVKSYVLIQKHQKDIGEVFSFEDGISLQWVKLFLGGFICWFVAVVLDGFVNFGSIEEENFFGKHTYDFVTSVYIVFVGLKALQQATIDKILHDSQKGLTEEIEEENAAINESELKQDKFGEIWIKCESIMNSHSPYTSIDLSIYDLSKLVETNYKYLSKAIKDNSNQNFASYINSYRVEESMHLLKNENYSNYTIEALAEMSGFKSKSAFNTAFKKNVGLTPSEFKKQN